MAGDTHTRRRLLALGSVVLTAGCETLQSDSTDTRTDSCERPTPESVAGITVKNELDSEVALELTIRKGSGEDTTVIYEQNSTVAATATTEFFEIFPEDDTYRIETNLDTGASETAEIETRPDREQVVSVRITGEQSIEIGVLNVVPPSTPTFCP